MSTHRRRRRRELELIRGSFEATHENRNVEVNQQTQSFIRESKTGQDVYSIPEIEHHVLVVDGKHSLGNEREATIAKLVTQTRKIYALQQPGAKHAMNFNRALNDDGGYLIQALDCHGAHFVQHASQLFQRSNAAAIAIFSISSGDLR